MMEDLYLQKEDIEQQLEDGEDNRTRSRNEILLEQLNNINQALGEATMVQDDLVAYWDEVLERGEMPDLDMSVEDLREVRRQEKFGM